MLDGEWGSEPVVYKLLIVVAAVRAAVATGASGQTDTRHISDTWKCGSLSSILTHRPEDGKKKKCYLVVATAISEIL